MSRLRFVFVLALVLGLVLAGCTPPTAPAPTNPPQPTAPPPTPANTACTLTATVDLTIYNRPSTQSVPFGNMPAGMTIEPAYRTADGWYGFDPGVAQAGNSGIFRMRWVQPGNQAQISGNCDQLPLAPPLPAGVCFLMPLQTTNVYTNPDTQSAIVGTLGADEYAEAIARGPGDWVQVNLDSGNNTLAGTGWVSLSQSGLNGPCDHLPQATQQAQATQPPATQPPSGPPPPPNNDNEPIRIQFTVGAITWQNPVDPQASYVFNAMQGQSVEILVQEGDQPADAALALAAPNGEPLQTYNIGRPDWRGVLPQSGDYQLSIAAPNGVQGLTLIVTIYPLPGDPQPITDTNIGFHLVYDGHYFMPEPSSMSPNEVVRLNLIYTDFLMNTNLEEAYFIMGLEPYNNADSCLNAPPEGIAIQEVMDPWRVNGVDYRYYKGHEGAAGHAYSEDIFRTYVHNRCVTVYFFTNTVNAAVSGTTPYDEKDVMDEFKRVFFTLQWP